MQVYELLRPGRAKDKAPLLDAAKRLRNDYSAERMAASSRRRLRSTSAAACSPTGSKLAGTVNFGPLRSQAASAKAGA